MSICCWVFRLRISLIVNVARKVWEKKICDCWHRTRRWLENWRKCQCCQVTWHSCSNHSNNLLFSLLMIEGAGTGKKIIWMGKMSNTIWFSFHTKRKIKWILLSQTLKIGAHLQTHTHTYKQPDTILENPYRNRNNNIICNCHSFTFAWDIQGLVLRVQWHYMQQSNTWLWFDVQSNCIPFQWERKFNSNRKNAIVTKHKRRRNRKKSE